MAIIDNVEKKLTRKLLESAEECEHANNCEIERARVAYIEEIRAKIEESLADFIFSNLKVQFGATHVQVDIRRFDVLFDKVSAFVGCRYSKGGVGNSYYADGWCYLFPITGECHFYERSQYLTESFITSADHPEFGIISFYELFERRLVFSVKLNS